MTRPSTAPAVSFLCNTDSKRYTSQMERIETDMLSAIGSLWLLNM